MKTKDGRGTLLLTRSCMAACVKNQHALVSLDDAHKRIEAWLTGYNSVRRHSPWKQLAPGDSGNCINRKPPSPLTFEWCTRWGS
ncbi:transposase [Burkholderia multivorans]|nr:transposase [Burkholderia multivorans]